MGRKYMSFIGPGIMVAVAYIDPGNYSTATSAGSTNQFSLLFFVLLSNLFAIFLQTLCIKLGSVTGHDLSRACREYLPPKVNLGVYFFAEAAIIATDVAEVIGSAIALNILIKVPLPAGVAISCLDVLIVLLAYRPGASLRFVKFFEIFVALLVVAVVICFCFELSRIPSTITVRQVLRGYAPLAQMLENNGIYQATAILGATVMPHSLFLGSGLVQPRLRDFDLKNGFLKVTEDLEEEYYNYKPSLAAINHCYRYSVAELAFTLFTFAMFVNSAILIVSGATLYGTPEAAEADLYGIHHMLSELLAPIAGTIFMLALLFSGQSAGIVCTIAGQIVGEGHINWTCKPWKRRLITRSITIVPCLAISISLGKNALNTALNVSQVVLSLLLPFLTAPLIWFTAQKRYMKVKVIQAAYHDEPGSEVASSDDETSASIQSGPLPALETSEGVENPPVPVECSTQTSGLASSFSLSHLHALGTFLRKSKAAGPAEKDQVECVLEREVEVRSIGVEEKSMVQPLTHLIATPEDPEYRYFHNTWWVTTIAVLIWLFISALNIFAIVQMAQEGI